MNVPEEHAKMSDIPNPDREANRALLRTSTDAELAANALHTAAVLGMHTGLDPEDPRFTELLGDLLIELAKRLERYAARSNGPS